MSTINVTNLSGRGGATPNLPDGANITGVATATSFDGSLKSTGTPTLGLGVTINASGISVSGVLTATTFKGDGSSLTGVGESLAPWHYNPDVNDTLVPVDTGIGITFSKKVLSGSGTATIKIVNAGVAGTTIQSWGVSSATYNIQQFNLDALVSDLIINQTYQLDIPEGFIVSSTGTNYAGTAYTFTARGAQGKLFTWGNNNKGQLGHNTTQVRSSPIQVPGSWSTARFALGGYSGMANNVFFANVLKDDGTLWSWGYGAQGALGQGDTTDRSSPVQIPGTTWATTSSSYYSAFATKTDGTLWAWGRNNHGNLAQNNTTQYSSPKQIPGTTWAFAVGSYFAAMAVKTDGTLWAWGNNGSGQLGQNNMVQYSSPVQVPGTTWTNNISSAHGSNITAVKTDGTAWGWGSNTYGQLGLNQGPSQLAGCSSPIQIPGTTWKMIVTGRTSLGTKTDGTLWSWGLNNYGNLGLNGAVVAYNGRISSPAQIPGTTWSLGSISMAAGAAIKTDGTLWVWGDGNGGQLGQNSNVRYSSPVQIPGTEWSNVGHLSSSMQAIQNDQTP